MLHHHQVQQAVFSQTMALNLSFLQMNKISLNILMNELSQTNPLIKTDNNYTPWKSTYSKKHLPIVIEETLIQEKKIFDTLREEFILELDESELPILYLIIGNLSPSGFLDTPLKTLCQGMTLDLERVEKIRLLIMESSYLGLASLNSTEYLLFMAQYFYQKDSIEYQIAQILPKYKNKKISIDKLSKDIDTDIILIEKALTNLKKIATSPLGTENSRFVYPDFIVSVEDEQLTIKASPFLTPSVSIKDYKDSTYPITELKKFLKEATTIKKALDLRMEALQKHASALILARSDFFLTKNQEMHQEIKLKDIAKITGRHISTVSRALKNRYFLFENHVYPFSVLWNHKIGNSNSYTVKKLIRQFVENENNDTPLSDTTITQILNKKGIKIARRTVNKYRKELKIESSYQR